MATTVTGVALVHVAFLVLKVATPGPTQAVGDLGLGGLARKLEDQTWFIQREVQVKSEVEVLTPQSAQSLQAAVTPLANSNLVAHLDVGNSTGHLHHVARRARWVGWQLFSDGEGHDGGKPLPFFKRVSHKENRSNFFGSVGTHEWIVLAVVCFLLCLLDGIVLRQVPDTFRWHVAVIFIWIFIAALYLLGVWARMGRASGLQWISGYVLEWMLSMDNLFIFHLVFKSYKTPANQIRKAVFVGIIGAVLMRMIFFLVVSTLLTAVGWFRWPFGAMLVWSGLEAVRGEDDDDQDVKDTRLVRGLRWLFGSAIKDGYDTEGDSIILRNPKTQRLQLSMLFVVILLVEFSDIIFALDSVSAKVAQIPNQYIAFSSSVMAMYGLRAMFFIVEDLVQMFDLLKYGLGAILVFIGIELMFTRWIHVGSGLECLIIVAIFAVCIAASMFKGCLFPEEQVVAKLQSNNSQEQLVAKLQSDNSKEEAVETQPSDSNRQEEEAEFNESPRGQEKPARFLHSGQFAP